MEKEVVYRRRLRHLLDFVVESLCHIKVASEFLFAIVDDDVVRESRRANVIHMMIAYQMLLITARLIDKRKDSHSLKKFLRYGEILDDDVYERIQELVDSAYDNDKVAPLWNLRTEWIAHVQSQREIAKMKNFNPAMSHVYQTAEEVAKVIANALGIEIPSTDEYLRDRDRIAREGKPEHIYRW